MTQPIKVAFEAEGKVVPIDAILPTRSISALTRKSKKYLRIQASIQEVGIVEPIVVHPQPARGRSAQYLLLDGHLRLDVLREQGATEVLCLISTDDEGFTYNHKVNQISPIQEHFMIMKALESGVSGERVAATLNVDVAAIRRKRDLLEGICPEAVELLRDKRSAPGSLQVIKNVMPMRQIEMAELMIASNNFSASYAKCLLAATPEEQLVEKNRPKDVPGLRLEDMARMEREMHVLEKDFRRIQDSHGRNTLNLVLAAGYLRKLLENAALVRFLSRKYGDILSEFERLAEAPDLEEGDGQLSRPEPEIGG